MVGDTHLGQYKSADLWHETTLKLFKSIVDTCIRRDIKTIVHLGDFFDNRRHLNVKTLYTGLQIADLLKDFETYIIIGNHDTFYKDKIEPTSLSIFGEHGNIHIIHEITKFDDAIMVPWGANMKDVPDAKYLLGHLEINGFPVVQGYEFEKADITIKDFKRFGKVYSGHFHIPSHKGNITYLGAALQTNFGDTGSKRGYYIFDNDELEFVEFNDGPKFVVITTADPVEPQKITGNIVKMIYLKDYGSVENNKILENIQMYGPLYLFTDFGKITNIGNKPGVPDAQIQLKSNKDILDDFINKISLPDHIKKSTLRNIITMLLKEEHA